MGGGTITEVTKQEARNYQKEETDKKSKYIWIKHGRVSLAFVKKLVGNE